MTHSVSFEPTTQDLLATYRLSFITSLRSKRVIRAYIVETVISALITAAALWAWRIAPIGWAAPASLIYWVVFLLLRLLLVYRFRLPRRARYIFAQKKSLRSNVTVAWSTSGISFTTSQGYSHYEWPDFTRIVKGKDVVLLRQGDILMNFIPIRILTAEQIDDLMQVAHTS